MGKVKIITADQAAALVEDNTTVTTSGLLPAECRKPLQKLWKKDFWKPVLRKT